MPNEQILNPQLTTTNNPGNNLSPEMKTFYDKMLIRFASPNLIHAQFGQKRPIPKNSGKTVEFRKFMPLPKALKPLTEGVTPKGNKLNVTSILSTVEQYGDYIATSDMLKLTAIDNIIAETQKILADQAGRTLDTVIREKINAGFNVQYGNGKAARSQLIGGDPHYEDNDYLNVNTVKAAVATLKRNNAKPIKNGHYVAVVHPDVANDLMSDPLWKDIKNNDPKDWYNGAIGAIHGVVFVESTEAKIFRAGTLRDPATYSGGDPACLTVVSVTGKVITVAEDITASDVTYLSGKKIQIKGVDYTIASTTAGTNGTGKITTSEALSTSIEQGNIIYAGGGAANGRDVYATLFIGDNAYGVTDIEGGGLQTIVKQKGSGDDPLDQRSTVGWKATQTAEILSSEFLVRVETTCSFGNSVI